MRILLTGIKIILASAAVFGILLAAGWAFSFESPKPTRIGVTFSDKYARSLGLDWKEAYLTILSELEPKMMRVVAYWDDIESEKGKFNFDNLDFQIREAGKRGVPVTLAIGYRVPRWPECHVPNWVSLFNAPQLEENTLAYLRVIVERYKNDPAIFMWQVENEPLFPFFGHCPAGSRQFLKEEIALVKSLDPSRKIMTTDSGELSLWIGVAGLSDVLGTTMYRVVWNPHFGQFKHFLPPSFYTLRAYLVQKLTGTEEVVISELQAEPWAEGGSLVDEPIDEQTRNFSVDMMKNNVEFAKRTGLTDIYLWGAEWWYWVKLKGNSDFWNAAKEMMREP